jgi:hypothetical protein
VDSVDTHSLHDAVRVFSKSDEIESPDQRTIKPPRNPRSPLESPGLVIPSGNWEENCA